MKSKLLLAITAGLLFCSTQQKAQVANYTFTQTLSTYGAANTGTFIGDTIPDDQATTVSLPFPFVFNGTSYSSADVSSNGSISFTTLTGGEYFPISDPSTSLVISPMGGDLVGVPVILANMTTGSATLTNCSSVGAFNVGDKIVDYAGDFNSNPTIIAITGNSIVLNQSALNTNTSYEIAGLNSHIKQNVSGATPNRICEFEFAHFSRFSASTFFGVVYDENITFKIRLYETSNKIEFLYGTNISGMDNTPFEIGLKGSSISDYNTRKVISGTNTWSNSIASTSVSDYCDFASGITPLSGQSYMWTPPSCTVPVLGVAASNSVSCAGQTVVLTASGATSYSWTNGPTTAQNTVTPNATTTYTLIGANTTCTSSVTYTQHVAAAPTLSIASNNSVSCAGQTVVLTASGATSYSWNAVAAAAQNTVSPAVTTTYSLTGSNGTCTANQTFTQTVMAYPVLMVVPSSTFICPSKPATLTVSGATTYSLNNVTTPTTAIISTPGTYTVAGANGNCVSTKTLSFLAVSDCFTGIKEASLESAGISAYPNPFGSALNIKNTSENELTISISDALGKVIYNAKVKSQSVETISGDSLTSGLYFISVQGANVSITKKLIKQ